jgi:glycosyltransferase domain-containing protein
MVLMTLIEDLTMFIPTYKRHDLVLRSMRYWRGKNFNVHILDGTPVSIENGLLEEFRGTNIHYHHMPCSIEERFGNAITLLQTPYVVYLCDDEFFIPSALEKCVETLKEQKDLVACLGRCLGFHPLQKGITSIVVYPQMKNYRNDKPTSRERMITYMLDRIPTTFYAVQRSEVWKNSMHLIADKPTRFTSPYTMEIQLGLATSYQGKSIIIDDLMWLRNMANAPLSEAKYNRKLEFYQWLQEPQYRTEVEQFYDITATALSKIDGRDKETVLGELKSAVKIYVDNFTYPSFLRKLLSRIIPAGLKRTLKGWKLITNAARNMERDGVTVNFEQLQEITECIMNSKLELVNGNKK